MLNNKIKGLFSLISSALTHLIIGNGFTFGNFVYYYRSYLHYKNINSISILDLLFIVPVSGACLNIFPILTGYIDKILGIRILTIIATLCLLTSQLIIYFYTKYYLMIIAYIFFGFAGSITYLPTVKNCWKYFPKKKGIISGIIFSSCGLSTFLFTSIGDYIINPKTEGKINKDFYSKEIAMRYTKYLKFYITCIITLGTISSIFSFPYKEEYVLKEKEDIEDEVEKINIDEKKDNKDNDNEKNEDENVGIINEGKDNRYSVQSYKNEEIIKINDTEKEENLTIKECLFSRQFLQCFVMVGCTLLFGFLLTNTYRPFGTAMKLNEFGIQTLSKVFTLLNTSSRILWGLLYDKFGFKYPYFFVCINQIACSSLIYFSAKNIYTYFLCCCFGVLSFSGHIILFPNLITKKFGIDNSVTLLGVCGILGGSTCLLGPVLTSSIIKENSDYLKTYLIAGSTTIISLALTFIIKIEKMKKSDLSSSAKIRETSKEKNKENTPENNKDNTPENNQDNNAQNIKDNKAQNIKDNNEQNIKDNTQENKKDNNSQNIKDNTQENTKDNNQENNKNNNPGNMKDNTSENNKDNAENNEEIKKDNFEEKIQSNNVQENIENNNQENNSDNIIENRDNKIDNIGKEEIVTENLSDNKEEKLIDN